MRVYTKIQMVNIYFISIQNLKPRHCISYIYG